MAAAPAAASAASWCAPSLPSFSFSSPPPSEFRADPSAAPSSSPACLPFPIWKTTLLLLNTYLLLLTAFSFFRHRSLRYSKKSWSFTFLILT